LASVEDYEPNILFLLSDHYYHSFQSLFVSFCYSMN